MAESTEKAWGMATKVVVVLVILFIIVGTYMHFTALPAGALTVAQYNQLDAAGKLLYKVDPSGNYYVKAA